MLASEQCAEAALRRLEMPVAQASLCHFSVYVTALDIFSRIRETYESSHLASTRTCRRDTPGNTFRTSSAQPEGQAPGIACAVRCGAARGIESALAILRL